MSSELFFYGLKITAIGMGIVFAILFFMQLLLKGISYALKSATKVNQDTPEQHPLPEAAPIAEPAPASMPRANEPSLGVLVAISAALAAIMKSRPVNIISIRKDIPAGSAWQQAARLNSGDHHHN